MSDEEAATVFGLVAGFVVGGAVMFVIMLGAYSGTVRELHNIKEEIVVRGYASETALPGGEKAIIWKENGNGE